MNRGRQGTPIMTICLRWACVFLWSFPLAATEPRFMKAWGQEGIADGEFMFCIGAAIHDDTLYVTDHYNNRLQAFDFEGKHLKTIPVLPYPGGITADKDGLLFITHFPATGRSTEKYEDRVSVYQTDGTFVREFGKSGTGDGELSWAGGLAIGPDDHVYVADQTNRRVMIFTKEGRYVSQFGKYGVQPGEFGGTSNPKSRVGGPQFVAFDKAGHIYTTEGMICRVQKLTKDGRPLLHWGEAKDEPGQFGGVFKFPDKPTSLQGPVGLAFDRDDKLWVVALNGRIQQFDTDGQFLGGIQTGQGTDPGKFQAPHGIAINRHNDLFIVDSYNQRIQKFATK